MAYKNVYVTADSGAGGAAKKPKSTTQADSTKQNLSDYAAALAAAVKTNTTPTPPKQDPKLANYSSELANAVKKNTSTAVPKQSSIYPDSTKQSLADYSSALANAVKTNTTTTVPNSNIYPDSTKQNLSDYSSALAAAVGKNTAAARTTTPGTPGTAGNNSGGGGTTGGSGGGGSNPDYDAYMRAYTYGAPANTDYLGGIDQYLTNIFGDYSYDRFLNENIANANRYVSDTEKLGDRMLNKQYDIDEAAKRNLIAGLFKARGSANYRQANAGKDAASEIAIGNEALNADNSAVSALNDSALQLLANAIKYRDVDATTDARSQANTVTGAFDNQGYGDYLGAIESAAAAVRAAELESAAQRYAADKNYEAAALTYNGGSGSGSNKTSDTLQVMYEEGKRRYPDDDNKAWAYAISAASGEGTRPDDVLNNVTNQLMPSRQKYYDAIFNSYKAKGYSDADAQRGAVNYINSMGNVDIHILENRLKANMDPLQWTELGDKKIHSYTLE